MTVAPVAAARALVLPVGRDRYLVPLEGVREVRELPGLTRVPGAPAVVLGVLNLRGRVVVVLDTGRLLGLEPVPAPTAVVVVELERGLAGLVVSATPWADDLGDDLGPAALEGTTRRHRVAGGGVASLLDVEAVLDPARLER